MNEAQKISLKLAEKWLDSISDEQFLDEYLEIVIKQKDKTIKFQNEYIMQLSKEKCALQAKIDALMLEFCPEEMTKEQIERWQESQEISTWSANGEGLDSLLNLNPAIREIYGNDKLTKPNQHCYWDRDYQCWTEDDNHFRNRLKSMVTE